MINIVLVGLGAWGQRYISTIYSLKDVTLTIANRENWKHLINNKPDGVIVCTPPQSHIEIASFALAKDIPTMIEKPLSLSLQDALSLQQYSAPILVNHSHLFSHRYQTIKNAMLRTSIKSIYSFGLGTNSHQNYSALWDYGPHDLSMILDVSQQFPKNIKCFSFNHNCFFIILKFDKFTSFSLIGAHTNKFRLLQVINSNNVFNYNDIYDKNDRSLTNSIKVFINAIKGESDSRLGIDLSLKIIQILEECQLQLII